MSARLPVQHLFLIARLTLCLAAFGFTVKPLYSLAQTSGPPTNLKELPPAGIKVDQATRAALKQRIDSLRDQFDPKRLPLVDLQAEVVNISRRRFGMQYRTE